MERMLSLSEQFFELPAEQKANFKLDLVCACKLQANASHNNTLPADFLLTMRILQKKNIGWESGQQKRASAKVPELKESLQLKRHDMEGKWPTDE